jgi:hypothetical protein
MGKMRMGREEVDSVVLQAAEPGNRAVFLVEAQNAGERQKVRELFSALAELADVAPLCDGAMMAFAIQLRAGEGSRANTLFGKLELALKQEFAFSLVERSFNDVIYHLVASLCEDSGGQMQSVPQCGICSEPEPFPTRVTFRDRTGQGIVEACYCARCSAQQADPSDREFLLGLLGADRRELPALKPADLIDGSAECDIMTPRTAFRIAS